MRAFLLRLLGAERPATPRVSALFDRLVDLELRADRLEGMVVDGFKAVNARITNKLRAQAAPGATNGDEGEVGVGGDSEVARLAPGAAGARRAPSPSAHLARRFRGF